jgi:hypothetical protein
LTIWMKMFQAGLNWWSRFLLKLPHRLISQAAPLHQQLSEQPHKSTYMTNLTEKVDTS